MKTWTICPVCVVVRPCRSLTVLTISFLLIVDTRLPLAGLDRSTQDTTRVRRRKAHAGSGFRHRSAGRTVGLNSNDSNVLRCPPQPLAGATDDRGPGRVPVDQGLLEVRAARRVLDL